MPSWSDALQNAEREMWDDVVDGLPTVADEAVVYDDEPQVAVMTEILGHVQSVKATYGVVETNPIEDWVKVHRDEANEIVDLADPRLGRIVRLRLLTDRDCPFWDLSYCYGVLKDGTKVRVRLPQSQFPKRELNGALIAMCKGVGVFGKGLGIFDPEVISKLYG